MQWEISIWIKRRRCCCTLGTSCLRAQSLLEINCILRIPPKCPEFHLQMHWLGRGSTLLFSFSLSRDSDSATAPNHPPTRPAERPTNQQCNVVFRQQALSVYSINQLRCISSLPETKHPLLLLLFVLLPPPPAPPSTLRNIDSALIMLKASHSQIKSSNYTIFCPLPFAIYLFDRTKKRMGSAGPC